MAGHGMARLPYVTTAWISQPCYLSWAGWYGGLARADVAILLDTVELSKQSWQTRNRVRLPDGRVVWLTVPIVQREHQLLSETRIDNRRPWRRKHWGTLVQAYRNAPCWESIAWLETVYQQEWETLADLNAFTITGLAMSLGIDTPIVRASELGSTRAGRIERLIDLCRLVDADTLLEPMGGHYLEGVHLPGISVEWFNYTPTPYEQRGQEWCSHLSVVDVLAHTGGSAASIIRGAIPIPR